MMRHGLTFVALIALAAPAFAQADCVAVISPDGAATYEAPSSGDVVTVAADSGSLTIEHAGAEQTCRMSFEDRSNVGLGETWFPANRVNCKKFDAQMSFVSPRDGGEMLMIFDGMTFYPKCAE